VPIMFRLAGPDIEYITKHSECKAIVVEAPFVELIDSIKDKLPIPEGNYIISETVQCLTVMWDMKIFWQNPRPMSPMLW